jgi:hypothetical protein
MAMTLALITFPAPEPRERLLVPPCLQPRAPLTFEIRDEHNHAVHPTLAGYKLRWGTTYYLRVRTQDRDPTGWSLRLLAPRSIIEPPAKDEVDGDARRLAFETRAPGLGLPGNWFSQVSTFPFCLDFANGREPYQASIPVILKASRFRWIVYLLATALVSYLSQAWYRESLTLPTLPQLAWAIGIWLAIVLGSILLDEWKFYRQAVRQLEESQKSLACQPGTALGSCVK